MPRYSDYGIAWNLGARVIGEIARDVHRDSRQIGNDRESRSRDEIVSAIGSKRSREVVDGEEKNWGEKPKKKTHSHTRYGERSDNGESLRVACRFVSYHRSNGTKRDCRRYLGTREIARLYERVIWR